MRIETGAEAVQETDRARRGRGRGRGAGLPQGGPEGPEEDVKDGAGGPGPVVDKGPKTFGTERTNWRTGTWGMTWSIR